MRLKLFILSILFLFNTGVLFAEQTPAIIKVKIVAVGIDIPDSLTVEYYDAEMKGNDEIKRVKLDKKQRDWTLTSKSPVFISIIELGMVRGWFCEPGDDITIYQSAKSIQVSGHGAEKFRLQNTMRLLSYAVKKPSNPAVYYSKSLDDYLEWHSYWHNKWNTVEPELNKYKDSISSQAWQYIKAFYISNLEKDRHEKFWGIRKMIKEKTKTGISEEIACAVYDSTFFSDQAVWMRSQSFGLAEDYGFIQDQAFRKFNFSPDSTAFLNNEVWRRQLYYEQGKVDYKGLALEKFLAYLITNQVIKEIGFTSEAETFLVKYYNEPRNPEYVSYVKGFVQKSGMLRIGQYAPGFVLSDANGKEYSKKDFYGKLLLINFTNAGYLENKKTLDALREIKSVIKGDSNVVILNVSVNDGKRKNDDQKNTNVADLINLTTGEKGEDHIVLKAYGISQYPTVRVVDQSGKILANPNTEELLNRKELVQLLSQQLTSLKNGQWALTNDGPYILKEDNSLQTLYIAGENVNVMKLSKEKGSTFTVHADRFDKYFTVQLKNKLAIEPSIYEKPEKLLVLSDIEGNFDVFRELLQSNNVIDEDYNWKFGKGHLVIAGDVFDRGKQVTECLWLIYSLEEKAKLAGGYVHFILGNHEIMNLSGNTRYVDKKYQGNAFKLGKQYPELFGKNTELGSWLRTKNVIEKIGDFLFVHGGISKEVNDLDISLPKLNEIVRPYLDKDKIARESVNKELSMLYHLEYSPFWYRRYYMTTNVGYKLKGNKLDTVYKTSTNIIDATLAKYQINHIVTGHTVDKNNGNYGKYVSAHFNGKIINTDTRHKAGYSEALLIIGDLLYRVNKKGEQVLLIESNNKLANHLMLSTE